MRHLVTLVVAIAIVQGCGDSSTPTDTEDVDLARELAVNAEASRVFKVALTAAEEVPASNSVAYGFSHIGFGKNNVVEVATRIWNPGCETFVAAHIHLAPPGAPGPVVIPLFSGTIRAKAETFRSRVELAPDVVQAVLANPEAYYINYHSQEHPPGAIRGQLSRTPDEPNPPEGVRGPCRS